MINENIECLECGEWLGSVRGTDFGGPTTSAQFDCECGTINVIVSAEELDEWL